MDSFVFLICITIFTLLFSLSYSEIMVLPLSHYLSKTQFKTTHHLLKSTSTTSATKFQNHKNRHQPRRQVSLPLSPGSDYTISFTLGSQTVSLYLDTGSDVVWLPCHPFECILCEGKYNPSTIPHSPLLFNLSSSASPVNCMSPACSAVHSSLPTSDLCSISKCPLDMVETSDCQSFSCPPFYYAYGDGSFIAKLYRDGLSIPMSTPSLVLKNFTFGCAHSSLGEPIGVAGFGNGALSLPAQLASTSPEIGNYFSYCLVSHSFDSTRVNRPSPLILGRRYNQNKAKQIGGDSSSSSSSSPSGEFEDDGFAFTPMLENPKHPYFYCVGLHGVSVGKKRIPAPDSLRKVDVKGNGGMVVDSGTTYTMLPKKFYETVVEEFDRRVGSFYKRAGDVETRTGLSPCYYVNDNVDAKVVPRVVLHFGGENSSSVVLPKRNYFYEFMDGGDDGKVKRKVGCVMLMNGGDVEEESSGPAGLLGNYQQQGFEVVYDLEKRRVGFARRKCASLWDTLNRR